MPSCVWIFIPRHSLACFTRATRRVILCPPPSSSHAKDYRLFAHRPQSHVSPARISLRRMRSEVAQAQSSKIPLTMRCPGPDKVKEQEAMTGSMSGKEKHDAEHRQGSLPFRLDLDSCALQSWRPQVGWVAPINHDAILILAREYSRGYSSLSSHSKLTVFVAVTWQLSIGPLVHKYTTPCIRPPDAIHFLSFSHISLLDQFCLLEQFGAIAKTSQKPNKTSFTQTPILTLKTNKSSHFRLQLPNECVYNKPFEASSVTFAPPPPPPPPANFVHFTGFCELLRWPLEKKSK